MEPAASETCQESTPQQKLPTVDDYLHPLSKQDLLELQPKVEVVLNSVKTKIEENMSLYFMPGYSSIRDDQLKHLFKISEDYSCLDSQDIKYNIIVDSIGFIHKYSTEDELATISSINTLNVVLLEKLFSMLNDKGCLMIVMDYHYLKQLYQALQNVKDLKSNLFIKLFIIEKLPLVGMVYLQKLGAASADFEHLKLLSYEIYEDLTITKPISYYIKDLGKSLAYMNEMYQYQGFLSTLRPGNSIKINIKENFWSENIEYSFTIVDSNDEELISKKSCVAIIVSKSYANDFIYLTQEGNLALCEQVKSSRVILIRPAPFNKDSINQIKEKISHYILLFRFSDCVTSSIPIMLMSDSNKEEYEVFKDNRMIIKDVVENDQKETFRQLIFHESPNEVQSEVKLQLRSKTKIKNDTDNVYIQLPTIEKYREKHLVSCLDENFICSFYIKTLLSGIFFLNLEEFPEKNLNVLILGAGIGTINYFFNMIFKSKVEITSIELDKSITELGQKYFGMNNFEQSNYHWEFMDGKEYLEKMKDKEENKYDMIIIDINNTNPQDGISPPPVFFDEEVIESIKTLMKPSGIYVINLMARSFKNYGIALATLEKVFPLLFLVENNEDLNKIHFCFKTKKTNSEYIENYKLNLEKLGNKDIADISTIEKDHKKILARVVDTEDLKKTLLEKVEK